MSTYTSMIPGAARGVNPCRQRQRQRRRRIPTTPAPRPARGIAISGSSAVPAGLLDTSCTEVATLAEVLARGACVFRTRVWARAASTALDAAIALHRLDAALADLLDADNAEDEWRAA